MPSPILTISGIRKNYGLLEALRGVTFEVDAGELFGLVGPNGAGKTTLLSILACLMEPDAGVVQFAGQVLRSNDLSIRRAIGIGTQDLAIYSDLTARENLGFFGRLYGLHGNDLRRRVEEVLEFVGLSDRAEQRVATYSGGMKRRLNLGAAVVHRPRLLLLDEPTTGVDPQSRNHIFERVRQLNADGTTIIYTSHYMEEVQTLCPRIAILDYGRLIAEGPIRSLLQTLEGTITMRISGSLPAAIERLRGREGIRIAATSGDQLAVASLDVKTAAPIIMNALREPDFKVLELQIAEPTLEQVFLHLTQTTLRD